MFNFFDKASPRGNDRDGHGITCCFVQSTVLHTAVHCSLKLSVCKPLQTEAFERSQFADNATVKDTVAILNGQRKHRFFRILDTPSLLTHRFAFGCDHSTRVVEFTEHGGVFAASIAHARILPCGDAPRKIGEFRIGTHIDKVGRGEIDPRLAAETAATACEGYSDSIS